MCWLGRQESSLIVQKREVFTHEESGAKTQSVLSVDCRSNSAPDAFACFIAVPADTAKS